MITPVSRRDFLKMGGAAAAGLVIAVHVPQVGLSAAEASTFAPNVWLRIGADGNVVITLAKSEMGQGVYTALPMLVAEELEVDWKNVQIQLAPADREKYGDQGTGGSTSVRDGWLPLRAAGAAAREMLIAAAARAWSVDPAQCSAEKGVVVHKATGRALAYGELVAVASSLPVPKEPRLKDPKDFRLLGKRLARLDTPQKCDGSAVYGMDVRIPGMLYACVSRSPVPGGKVLKFTAESAMAVAGVQKVVQVDSGVAVIAGSTWAAMKGCESLEVQWEDGAGAQMSTDALMKSYRDALAGPAMPALSRGDVDAAFAASARKIDAEYELPYLAHAAMEPLNCTARVSSGACEIWASTQVPNEVQEGVAKALGLPLQSVKVNLTFLGGGFGRRLQNDDAVEAALVSRAAGAPVKVVWTRPDDIQHDFYRPNSLHKLAAALDAEGKPIAFTNRLVIPSIEEYLWPGTVKDGVDNSLKEEIGSMDYSFPSMRLDYVLTNKMAPLVPLGWWRSVYASQIGFALESFMDELAAAAGKDPFDFRMALLQNAPRPRGVLKLVAEKAGWDKPLPPGRGRGIAVFGSFGSWAAMVIEASADSEGNPRVHRAVCGIDCGRIVNPGIIEAQMQSAVAFGLSAAMYGKITIEGGKVQQSNYHDYEVLRIDRMPIVESFVVSSSEAPGGVGEPGVPVVAPALANALFAATGKRLRKLPFNLQS